MKELEDLLTAEQIQIVAAQKKSKIKNEAQKKIKNEKVLFLETQDQLVNNFHKGHG